ncbi:MAG: hypothetical protein GFH25_541276n15 [Chloroflexi bacterium AL-N10]|nr:hypothetical protein [Chloroflexi bacterium AL-N1]NOK71096.1 hypothetical protein [Chloroflexi bacterium AL-N10]NOK77343.1 hypothetical protein [Chloroflexi bacterium AL-N5]
MSDHTTDDAPTTPSTVERLTRALDHVQHGDNPPSAWIFQCNPRDYDLSAALDELDELTWVVRRHASEIQPGDLVYLWESGNDGGIAAVARVLTPPTEQPRDEREAQFYRVPERFEGNDPRVRLRIEQVLGERLTRDELQHDPQLHDMAILKSPQGTNFSLTAAEAERLVELRADRAEDANRYMTGAEAGLKQQQQMVIALQEMVRQGGKASNQNLYDAIEAHMDGRKLSQQGKDTLRSYINRDACDEGYVHPYDSDQPGWSITPEGRAMVEQYNLDIDDDGRTDAEELQTDGPGLRRADWEADFATTNTLSQKLFDEYMPWIERTFGRRTYLRFYKDQKFGIFRRGRWIQFCNLNIRRNPSILIANPSDEIVALLSKQLSDPQTLRPRGHGVSDGYRFTISTERDHALLQDITQQLFEQISDEWPPRPLDGPAFMVTHSKDGEHQLYGQTYAFSNFTSGASKELIRVLETFEESMPVYFIIYRTRPYHGFTAWAQVTNVRTETVSNRNNQQIWIVDLDQQEFPVALYLKDADTKLTHRLSWLRQGASDLRGSSIRAITPSDFATIINAARRAGAQPMSAGDVAFTVLRQAENDVLTLKEIYEQAQQQHLIDDQVSQLDLARALQQDAARFTDLGDNHWELNHVPTDAEAYVNDAFAPKIHAGSDAAFWRIHIPNERWEEARQHNVIGINHDNPNNQSFTRFRRINVGDRIVAYVQGGVVGGIGVVTQAYTPGSTQNSLFNGEYPYQIAVAWADAPNQPVPLYQELKAEHYTDLYNRLKNPHTVVPLSREDYVDLLRLMQVDDAGTPEDDTRLPPAWEKLNAFYDYIQTLENRPYNATELLHMAREQVAFNDQLDEDDLVTDLQQLRLITPVESNKYQRQPYTEGQTSAVLRFMALALLVPLEGTAETYVLPAQDILPQLRSITEPQPHDSFAPKLGNNGMTLLQWYAEAGLVTIDEETWQPTDEALEALSGEDSATAAHNQFLATLTAAIDGSLTHDLAQASGPLLPITDLDERLRELGQVLLIDEMIVRRIYRSLMAGRHVVLSGPPGTGKTELAQRLPSLLWREPPQTFHRLTNRLDQPPVLEITETRHGYAAVVVTATEDWGVRDVIGGIGPQLDGSKNLSYTMQYGALTRVILQHYEGTDKGRRLPSRISELQRRDYHDDTGTRYRGAWLVIDEFTRAPVDAAFGSLLTTLSGGQHASLAVPASSGEQVDIPLPADFRIIGTLNSFDRHFLNQLSEALKRRFDFIDVPPPAPELERYEQGIAAAQAFKRLHASGFDQISVEGAPPTYRWSDTQGVVAVIPTGEHYQLDVHHPNAQRAFDSFWRLFRAIRVFRQLGTAQAVAVYTNLLTGVVIAGMDWSAALDTALADSLADQLQVLTRDEQQVIEAYTRTSGADFVKELHNIFNRLTDGQRRALLHTMHEADQRRHGVSTITDRKDLAETDIRRVFEPGDVLDLLSFRKRLRDFMGERGL